VKFVKGGDKKVLLGGKGQNTIGRLVTLQTLYVKKEEELV